MQEVAAQPERTRKARRPSRRASAASATVPDGQPSSYYAQVTASIVLSDGHGLTGRLLSKATAILLKGGALNAAAGRIARAAEDAPCAIAA